MQVRSTAKGIYTREGLASEVGVSPRVIQRWLKEHVLSPALRLGGNPFVFTEDHLREALEIQRILENNMTLADIRDRLHPPADDEDDDLYEGMKEWFDNAY